MPHVKPTREPPPPQPLPAGFRRIDESRRRSSLKPPFGVARWSDDAESMVLVARTPSVDGRVRAIEHLVAQLPEDAKRGALLLIAPFALERRGFMGGLLAPRERKLARGVRAAALLVGGYHDIGAAADAATHLTWVWGYRN
jgi:hypothetical protein